MLALAIALIDALPAIGTGIILMPWSLVELIAGNYKKEYRFVLYLIILIVRQIIEPKIMSSSFERTVLTLIGMYAGLRLFGGRHGVVPIFLAIVYMQRAGLFVIWKTDKTT